MDFSEHVSPEQTGQETENKDTVTAHEETDFPETQPVEETTFPETQPAEEITFPETQPVENGTAEKAGAEEEQGNVVFPESAPAVGEPADETAGSDDASPAPPAPPEKTGKGKKPWNRKTWMIAAAAALVVVLLVVVIAVAAGGSPLDDVSKALGKTVAAVNDSACAQKLEKALSGGSITLGMPTGVLSGLYDDSEADQQMLCIKTYTDLPKNRAALAVDLPMAGQTISAALYGSDEALALEAPALLDKAYGVDLKAAHETLPTSIFASDSGSGYALDEEVYHALMQTLEGDGVKKNEAGAKAVKKAYETLLKELTKNVKKYAEIEKSNETIAIGQKPVKTSRVRVRTDGGALFNIVYDTLVWIRDDKGFERSVSEICEAYFELLNTDGYATEPQDLADAFYDAVYEAIEQSEDAGGYDKDEALILDFYITKSGGYLVQTEINVVDEARCVLTIGPDPASPELIRVRFDNGWDTVDVSYSVEENSGKQYTAQLVARVDGEEQGSVSIDWDKKEGSLRVKFTDGYDTVLVKGSLLADKNSTSLYIRSVTYDEDIIKPEVTLTVATNDKMPAMPEYTDILTLDENALEQLFTAAGSNLQGAFWQMASESAR